MDKKTTKSDFVKEIRKYLRGAGVRNGESVELNILVSSGNVIINGNTYHEDTFVKSISPKHIIIEWYTNGVRREWSGEYPYNDVNVNYGIVMNVAMTLRNRA